MNNDRYQKNGCPARECRDPIVKPRKPTAAERKWAKELEEVLMRAPKGIGLFTIGDRALTMFDDTHGIEHIHDGGAVRGVLYWIPRWEGDGRALYFTRADHWDRAASADVVRHAEALTVDQVKDAIRSAVRIAALHDLACFGGDEERATYEAASSEEFDNRGRKR